MDDNTRRIYNKYGIDPEEREKENKKLIDDRLKNIEAEFKELMLNEVKEKFERNFDSKKNHYLFTSGLFYFKELETYIIENIKCLILEYFSASITLSNLILERMLKLALIQYEVGIVDKVEDWNSNYKKGENFHNLKLWESIKECHNRGLIDDYQKEKLNYYREIIRNGFSHFDTTQIFKYEEETKPIVIQNLHKEKIEEIDINFKIIPVLQTVYTNKFAVNNAEEYFDYIMNTKRHLERYFLKKYYNENNI
jgi:hypothetical protein